MFSHGVSTCIRASAQNGRGPNRYTPNDCVAVAYAALGPFRVLVSSSPFAAARDRRSPQPFQPVGARSDARLCAGSPAVCAVSSLLLACRLARDSGNGGTFSCTYPVWNEFCRVVCYTSDSP